MQARATIYCIQDNMLYKKGFTAPLLRCIEEPEYRAVLMEIYAGYYGNHAGGVSLAQKALCYGFY